MYATAIQDGAPVYVPLETPAPSHLDTLGLLDVRAVGPFNPSYAGDSINQAMQEAFSAALSGVFVPPMAQDLLIDQIAVKKGMSLIGGGLQATRLKQPNGANKSAIVNDPVTLPQLEYMHWSRLMHFKLVKEPTSTDTLGCGIEINCRTGEDFTISHVNAIDFPESGYRLLRGGVPCTLWNVRGFRNKQYMLDVQRTGADNWQMFACYNPSGDNNREGLIRIKTAGANSEVFTFWNVKSESSTTYVDSLGVTRANQPNVFVLENMAGRPVYVYGVSAVNIGAAANLVNAVFKNNTGSSAGIRVRAVGIHAPSNWPLIINDLQRPYNLPHNINRTEFGYSTANGLVYEVIL